MRNFIFSVFFLVFANWLLTQVVVAENLSEKPENGFEWMLKVSDAPRQYNFQGTFVYYAEDHMETSRIIHRVDLSGEHERIEVLDGMPRIVYRNNEKMTCYLPENKKIYTEERWFRKFFPDLLPKPSVRIYDNYVFEKGKIERIAGHESQVIKLMPKDNLRYGYKLWAEVDSGLLLKAALIDKDEIIEQFAFAEVEIGQEINASLLNPVVIDIPDDWETVNLATYVVEESELNWGLGVLPEGFKIITEMKRNLIGKTSLIDHIVLSDELASVSVFVESFNKELVSPVPGFYSSRGAINIYVREVNDKKITTVGEVPLNTIKLIGDAVYLKP